MSAVGKHGLVQMVQGSKICYFQQNNYQVSSCTYM
jgi:hypothetical protein